MCPALHSLLLSGEPACLPVREKNREHGLPEGSEGAASNPPLCSQARIGDNVDNEGGIWHGAQCARTHTHIYSHTHTEGKHLGPGPRKPNQPAVSASVSPGRDTINGHDTLCDLSPLIEQVKLMGLQASLPV